MWLQCVVSTDERFMGALRMGDETPRYLHTLSNICSVCESGRVETCVGDVTNFAFEEAVDMSYDRLQNE